MARIFVFGNSYTVRSVLQVIDCILNFSVDAVIVLKENHRSDDQILLKKQISLCIYDTIDRCLAYCDLVLIIASEEIPEKSITRIIDKSSMLQKKCYLISTPLFKGETQILPEFYDNKTIPSILTLSFGKCTQLFSIEILLNNIFYESGITMAQHFSQKTDALLLQFLENGILHDSLSKQMISPPYSPSIVLYSLNIENNWYDLRNYMNYFDNIRPDFIIIHTDARFEITESFQNIIEFCCLSKIDMVVKSHYSMVDEKHLVFCDFSKNDDIYDIESDSLRSDIFLRIISKLTWPHNVKRLQI